MAHARCCSNTARQVGLQAHTAAALLLLMMMLQQLLQDIYLS
jgi:hypothetical protein